MKGNTDPDKKLFVEASRTDLLHFVERRVANNDEAEAIVQDAYLKFFRAGYDASSSNARPLLFTIAKNLLNDHHRKQQKRKQLIDPSPTKQNAEIDIAQESDSAENLHSARRLEKIIATIDALPPKRQQVFKLSRFEGLKNTEIAERLGITKSMVEKHLAAALKDLRSVT